MVNLLGTVAVPTPPATPVASRGVLRDWTLDGRPLHDWLARWIDADTGASDPRGGSWVPTTGLDDRMALLVDASVRSAAPARARRKRGDVQLLPSGRAALYVCGQCADYGCGTFAVRVRRVKTPAGDQFTWSDFAWEADWSAADEPDPDFAGVPAIEFDAAAYSATVVAGR